MSQALRPLLFLLAAALFAFAGHLAAQTAGPPPAGPPQVGATWKISSTDVEDALGGQASTAGNLLVANDKYLSNEDRDPDRKQPSTTVIVTVVDAFGEEIYRREVKPGEAKNIQIPKGATAKIETRDPGPAQGSAMFCPGATPPVPAK